jgi:hypothetical protein
MPPVKTTRYFDDPAPVPLILRVFSSRPNSHLFRRTVVRRIKRAVTQPFYRDHFWFLRYLLLPPSDAWYASLFRPPEGTIAGEICPSYARLGEETVAHIRELMPRLRIIFLLRNPIDRMWSQAAMHFEKHGYSSLADVDDARIVRFFDKPSSYRNSGYLETLRIWEAHFPPEQMFLGIFDRMKRDSGAFLKEIHAFLGLEASDAFVSPSVGERRNARKYIPIPEHHYRNLAEKHVGEIERLHERLRDPDTAGWLESARARLGQSPSSSSSSSSSSEASAT